MVKFLRVPLVLLAMLAIALARPLHAQSAVEVALRARNAGALPGVVVRLLWAADTLTQRVELTDSAGIARFPAIPSGRYRLFIDLPGYAIHRSDVMAPATGVSRTDVALFVTAVELPGLLVETDRRRARYNDQAGSSVSELTQSDLKSVPSLGEPDVLRAIEVLPGVVSTSDFSSAFNVRGGGADQNLILLDGLPIYNPFHLGGLFSVFNTDMIDRAELLSGGFAAQYGGRVSSVLSVESDAAGQGFDVQGGVSILATRVAVGTDIPRALLSAAGLESGRARISIRRSYFDQLLKPIFDFPYHLTDLQFFSEAISSGGARLTFTAYTGRDVLDLAGLDSFPLQVKWQWGNGVAGSTLTLPLGGTRVLTTRVGYSQFTTAIVFPQFGDTEFSSRIEQALLRTELSGRWNTSAWRVGGALDHLSYHNLAQSGGTVFGEGRDRGWMGGVFAQQTTRSDRWLIESGLRTDTWLPESGGARAAVQPRLAVKRFFGAHEDLAIKASIGRYAQFAHSLRDEELPLGIDIWVLSGDRAPVTISDQLQTGIEGFIRGNWYVAAEGYYRKFDGVVANNTAENPNDPNDDLLRGTGVSYGADFQLRRDNGRVRPMLAVSWLKATREFDDTGVDPDNPPKLSYPPIFDRRLDVDLVLQAMLPRDWKLSFRWNLGTGLPYTRPIGAYTMYDYSVLTSRWRGPDSSSDVETAVVLGPRNGERYPTYHRFDAGLRKTFVKRWGTLTPHLDVLNLYNRRNVLFYFYQYDRTPALRSGVSMFPLLPTIGLEMRF
ncbi:MAG: TonB-dependent receptor [Longimicrobiales bacterium]